ncbi:MAG: hypothetical protein QOI35_2697, partial [Cryptosporangiaceae bacterium]|nr:hypothetical protein [Cryptosporangiaceae bacterium]
MLALAGAAAAGAVALPAIPALAGGRSGGRAAAAPWPQPVGDPVADMYRELLLVHTRWVEQQWDPATGAYRGADFRFAAVLGNAVLLTTEGYDADAAGVDAATLKSRTIATIRRFAATNRLTGGTEWGRQLFWDSTFELYFVLAAKLMWADLDATTRANVDAIAQGQTSYAFGLGTANDPLSGDWTPNGTAGGWKGDTKLEEMGVYAQAMAPGLAWNSAGPDAALWRERFSFWVMNASSLPAADLANPAVVDGRAVAQWSRGHNLYDSFIVENHGSANPHYQAELFRTAGRAAIHFLAAGQPLPQALTHQPSGRELWGTLRLLASDAGEPVMPMVADRYHLYGRDVIPLAFLAQVQGDRHAARAEADLAGRLMPYLKYAPEYRLTKFSGEDKYEPEARAELAISYLFHRWRATQGGVIQPVTPGAFFAAAATTRDFGAEIGMTAQQSGRAFAAAVSKPGFTRFLWQPGHDNWLLDTRAPGFLPAGLGDPSARWTAAYRQARDGADATATVLSFPSGRAGFATLPTGSVVYATTGLGPDEGRLTLFSLDMPGVPGLTGSRTFTGASGSVTLSAAGSAGDGGTDELTFPTRQARYVRVLGRSAATQYGYSLYTFAVLGADGTDLAKGAAASASSADAAHPAAHAVDGDPATRWAVSREDRPRADSWLSVDLGSAHDVSGARLVWEAAYATGYLVQTSLDGQAWADAATVPDVREVGGWVDIDGRAGLVVQGAAKPIAVTATGVVASPGPAAGSAGLLVEGYVGKALAGLAAAASRVRASSTVAGLRVSDADGYLVLFNLSAAAASGPVLLPKRAGVVRLYRGVQEATSGGASYTASLAAGTGVVEPTRFTVTGTLPVGARFEVADSRTVTITAPAAKTVNLTLESVAAGKSQRVRVPAGTAKTITLSGGIPTPATDLARARTTFPTSPLPAGMGEPALAVDGDPATSWRPGPTGRMVVDLGSVFTLTGVRLTWTAGRRRPLYAEVSADGLSYRRAADAAQPARVTDLAVTGQARYVAVAATGWKPG